jgi:hypothetical protein
MVNNVVDLDPDSQDPELLTDPVLELAALILDRRSDKKMIYPNQNHPKSY